MTPVQSGLLDVTTTKRAWYQSDLDPWLVGFIFRYFVKLLG